MGQASGGNSRNPSRNASRVNSIHRGVGGQSSSTDVWVSCMGCNTHKQKFLILGCLSSLTPVCNWNQNFYKSIWSWWKKDGYTPTISLGCFFLGGRFCFSLGGGKERKGSERKWNLSVYYTRGFFESMDLYIDISNSEVFIQSFFYWVSFVGDFYLM